jgi:hypothetical protein
VAIRPSGEVLSTRLEPETADLLRERARAGYRTPAAELRRAVDQYLNDEAPAPQPALRETSTGMPAGHGSG